MQSEQRDIGDIVHERWLDFTQTLGEDGVFEDDIIASMRFMAEICNTHFGDQATAKGFTQIVRGAFPYRKEAENWEQILDQEFGCIFSDSAIGQASSKALY
ncbi:hypothetical protein [Lutimaribacter saemankumensis]|uniref:Uncharacterized protein n=1 Tax=Lutimaribacter saemankumensis TaxID=490829 RepID=A0A1G8K7B9_9RHOB|nr:hypothetical protein [Lutimaribacter saemankumensis]SDI39324.1 hypothetical protein SAMN05421850_102431 [Lutimaribacter saemankumensis]